MADNPQATGTYTQYTGSLTSLPLTSPGFHFLSAYLPAVDVLDRSSPIAVTLGNLLSPDAVFITNGGPAMTKEQIQRFLSIRENSLEKFGHGGNVLTAWDLEKGEWERRVICEAISVTVFKGDEKMEEVKVHELLVLNLGKAAEGMGVDGYWATEAKVYMDAGPVMAKSKMVREKNVK